MTSLKSDLVLDRPTSAPETATKTTEIAAETPRFVGPTFQKAILLGLALSLYFFYAKDLKARIFSEPSTPEMRLDVHDVSEWQSQASPTRP